MSNSFGSHRGTLNLRIGPMVSSKTSWLNMELTQYADTGFKCLKIIHSDDVRNDVSVNDASGSTHNSSFKHLTDKIDIMRVSNLDDIVNDDYHVIGIDESQFFPELYDKVYDWVENKGIHVMVVGLCGDFKKNKFGKILDLIPICDTVEKFNAKCQVCLQELSNQNYKGNITGLNAPFTKKIDSNNDNQKDVGGRDKYYPTCRIHHSI